MKVKLVFIILSASLISGIILLSQNIFDSRTVIEANVIEIVKDTIPEKLESLKKQLNLLDKIDEGFKKLENEELFVGDKKITYYENRTAAKMDGGISISNVKFSEEEKEIALAVLNLKSGKIDIIRVRKIGDVLLVPENYNLSVVTRINGIGWNYWNTVFNIHKPEDSLVVALKYPVVERKNINGGRGRIIEYVYYSPYSPAIHHTETILAGSEHINNTVEEAFNSLREKNIKSRSFPEKLVADIFEGKKDFFRRLPLLEHSDLAEFLVDPLTTVQRVMVLIGTNREKAFTPTCNSSRACGWVQFTPKTYDNIRRTYKSAGLIDDFQTGAADHTNSMMAAILLYDYNLEPLVKRYGEKIVDDPRLEEYLAASYNGSPSWVWQSLNVTLNKNVKDWTVNLKTETLGFITKLRFMIANELPYM